MQRFFLHTPVRLVFGKGMVKRVGRQLEVDGVTSVLLVRGRASARQNTSLSTVEASLAKHGVDVADQVVVQPGFAVEDLMLEQGKAERVQGIVALGGGSVMDAAKALAASPYISDLQELVAGQQDVLEALPMYAVPTLSGSGSEVNGHAVLLSRKLGRKTSAKGPALYPRCSVVDPTLQAGIDFALTARGALDAMSHVLEQYVMAQSQETAMALCEALMVSLVQAAEALRQDPDAYLPRADLAWASILAQNGTAGAGLGGGEWTVHVLAHQLNVSTPTTAHADLVAVLFPAWLERVQDVEPELFQRWTKKVWAMEDKASGIASWRETLKRWERPQSLNEVGLTRQDLEETLAHLPESVGRRFPLSRNELSVLLEQAWQGPL